MANRRVGNLTFALATIGFLAAILLLVAIAYFAPVDLSAEQTPKVAYVIFAFAAGMFASLFVDTAGLHRPAREDVKRKLPAILFSFLCCLAVIAWLNELHAYTDAKAELDKACADQLAVEKDIYGPILTDKSMQAEQRAIKAAQVISKIWAVRHPEKSEDTPCD